MPQNLASMKADKLQSFLNSFDVIFCDYDGVINDILTQKILPGVIELFDRFKKQGKNIYLLTNNTTLSRHMLKKKLSHLNVDDVVTPATAIISYLQKSNFEKEIYVIGASAIKAELSSAGLKLSDEGAGIIQEDINEYFKHTKNNPKVGAVIVDFDYNATHIKLLRASVYLSRPDVLYVVGSTIHKFTRESVTVMGPGFFQQALNRFCNREPISVAKPSQYLKQYVLETYSIADPSRALFIGDSLDEDMAFATLCGFRKLLVLSGLTTIDEMAAACKEETPDYYVGSLGKLHEIIEEQLENCI